MDDKGWRRGYGLLEKYELSFDLQLYPSQMLDAAALIEAHPNISVIINHTGMPDDKSVEGIQQWSLGMRALAAHPNVSVKLSGLGMLDWKWTEESIRPFILEAIKIFGVDRAMFASNFPVDRLYSSHDILYAAFKSIVSDFPETQQRALFHDNAERIYRL